LDWFDGILEAVVADGDGLEFHVVHIGDPPIDEAAVYRIRKLTTGGLARMRDRAAEGPHSHSWIVAPNVVSDVQVQQALEPVEPLVGFAQTSRPVGSRLSVRWFPAATADQLCDVQGAVLWQRITWRASPVRPSSGAPRVQRSVPLFDGAVA
jgi:hypothetical protein